VVDLEGDMTRPGADLVSGRIEVDGENVLVSIKWAPGGFIRDTSRVTVYRDTDQNPLTGSPGINTTGTVDGEVIGSEFLFKFEPSPLGDTGIARLVFTSSGDWSTSSPDCCSFCSC